ncbi:putative sinapoylglucose--sinapoylglucose O-sinapoyltransferase [Helianthus annuus]|nr:putative sinapoylglucose--sinapoylglucose O-sinapoyltransferase [Helianthus annuus]
MDFNSRLEYSHRMALISNDIYESAIKRCRGNYVNIDTANPLCAHSLQRYKQEDAFEAIQIWANTDTAQHALNISQGTIGKWDLINTTMHYAEGKNDTFCYSYDVFSSFAYHKKLTRKNCRALIFSGDHDMTFPYVGIEQWIASLNIKVIEEPWEPYYVDGQVGGCDLAPFSLPSFFFYYYFAVMFSSY